MGIKVEVSEIQFAKLIFRAPRLSKHVYFSCKNVWKRFFDSSQLWDSPTSNQIPTWHGSKVTAAVSRIVLDSFTFSATPLAKAYHAACRCSHKTPWPRSVFRTVTLVHPKKEDAKQAARIAECQWIQISHLRFACTS